MPNSVELIDPIESISSLPNGTPNIEDLFIFAELLGKRRERSVLTLNSNQGNVSLETQLSNSNINMLGVDFNESVNDSATFTTKWTDTVTNTTKVLEGFGVEKIEININSSFIPSVKISFVDIRGSAFYNLGENSPYSLLLDFPPPVFTMTIKGYYGRSLDYDLHLVKHNTRFDSNNGNYYIDVEFIARTFAPLSDVPFKFAEIVALMNTSTEPLVDPKVQQSAIQDTNNTTNQQELNVDPRVAPRNTYELVQKLKRLTDELKDIRNTSNESRLFDDARLGVDEGEDISNYIDSFSSSIGTIYSNNAFIIIKDDDVVSDNAVVDDGGEFRIINSVRTYRDIILQSQTDGNNNLIESNRLYLGVLKNRVRNGNSTGSTINEESLTNALLSYREALITRGINFDERRIRNSDVGQPVSVNNDNPVDSIIESDFDEYLCIDITEFYINVEKSLKVKRDDVDDAQSDLVELVNERLREILGFTPTIYNIFKILCDDLDIFFKTLGKVSNDSERHHQQFFDLIVDQVEETKSKNVTKKLYPFPLYIKDETTCGVTRKNRRFPDFQLPNPFPETQFVERFIDTIISVRREETVSELRTQIDVNGNNKWIPVTPADSELFGDIGYDSPYSNLELQEGVPDQISALYARLINRFYIASQFTYGNSFYSEDRRSGFLGFGNRELKRNDLIKFIARSEAVNVANSVFNDNVINSLIDKANSESGFRKNPQRFYDEVSNLAIYNQIPDGNSLRLTDNETRLFRTRNNPDYIGMVILDIPPNIRSEGEDNSPIGQFLDQDESWIDSLANYFNPSNENLIKAFSVENIPYFSDYSDNDSDIYTTKYINDLTTESKASNSSVSQSLGLLISFFKDELEEFLSVNSQYSDEAQSFILASFFGLSRSYFSEFGFNDRSIFNKNIGSVNTRFLSPAVVEVPRFSTYYMGALYEYQNDENLRNEVNEIFDLEWLNTFSRNRIYLDDDLTRIEKLSVNDRAAFITQYNEWFDLNNLGFRGLRDDIRNLISDINLEISSNDLEDTSSAIISRVLEFINQGRANTLKNDFVAKISILNFSEFTFNNAENDDLPSVYEPLSITNSDTVGNSNSRRSANDLFFNTFWDKLATELPEKKRELDEIDSDFRSSVEDEDIKTQLYYSFKNISDKWVSGIDTLKRGFPLNNDENDSLISKFAFVDRAMNPIGDEVVINAESLIEMSEDYDLNMFQVFSRLLSLNGFEFFPLQNFMVFDDGNNSWRDAFRIFPDVNQGATPAFVCMYIGGTSSTLESFNSDYDNDGILDLQEQGLPDFNNVNECNDSNEVSDSENRSINQEESRFNYSEPKAFRVRFAEQNQSFFTSIELEGREFPETADSLAILSRIAGDGKTTAPIPKGQNLFSIYENRAYSVTVRMLGNAMIQPTQYFQLENIPMYSGAYMITDVKHTISNNHMITEFTGVKILKYPNPFVRNFATVVGIESGTSEDLTATVSVTTGEALSASNLPNAELYNNSMFDLSISP